MPRLAIIGEPTSMKVVNAHKGIRSFRTTVTGREAHSSQVDRGVNAVMESFFSTVKSELADRFGSYSEAKMEVFDYLEVYYNQRRRHSTLGQISPAEFERRARVGLCRALGGVRCPTSCSIRPPPNACRLATTVEERRLIRLN